MYIYIDLRASAGYTNEIEKLEWNLLKIVLSIKLKNIATKKLELQIWGYLLSKYWYVLARDGLTLRHNTFSILQEDDNFLEWGNNQLNVEFGRLAVEKDDTEAGNFH